MLDVNPRSLTAGTIDVIALMALLASLYCRLQRQRATGRAILPRTAPWSDRSAQVGSTPSPSEGGAHLSPFVSSQSPSLFPQPKYSDDDGGEVKEKKRKRKETLQNWFRYFIQSMKGLPNFLALITKHMATVASNIRTTTAIAIHTVVVGSNSPLEGAADIKGTSYSFVPEDWRLLFAPRTITEWLADALCVWGNYLTFTVRNTFVVFSVLIALTDALSVGIASPRLSRKALGVAIFVTITGILGHWLNTALVLGLLSSWLSCILYGSLLCYDLAWPPAPNFSAGSAPTSSLVSEKAFSIAAQALYLWNLFADCRAREIALLPRWWIGTVAVFLQDGWLLYRFHQSQSQNRRNRFGAGGDLAAGLNFMLPPSSYAPGANGATTTYSRYPKETAVSFA